MTEPESENRTCPACGSTKVAVIVYGLPAPGAFEHPDVTEGRIVFGGCVICDDNPKWQCNDCDHSW